MTQRSLPAVCGLNDDEEEIAMAQLNETGNSMLE